MTYPHGALAMLCFALTYLYVMLVIPPLLARINARSGVLAPLQCDIEFDRKCYFLLAGHLFCPCLTRVDCRKK